MTVQFKFFTIPVTDSNPIEEEFNLFLRTKRVLTVYKEFLKRGEDARVPWPIVGHSLNRFS